MKPQDKTQALRQKARFINYRVRALRYVPASQAHLASAQCKGSFETKQQRPSGVSNLKWHVGRPGQLQGNTRPIHEQSTLRVKPQPVNTDLPVSAGMLRVGMDVVNDDQGFAVRG